MLTPVKDMELANNILAMLAVFVWLKVSFSCVRLHWSFTHEAHILHEKKRGMDVKHVGLTDMGILPDRSINTE